MSVKLQNGEPSGSWSFSRSEPHDGFRGKGLYVCNVVGLRHNSRLIEVTFTTVLTAAPLALPLHAGDSGYGLGSRHFVLRAPFKLSPVCPYAVQNDRQFADHCDMRLF